MTIRSTLAAIPRSYVIWAAVALIGYTLCQRSILLSDEGYILYQASEIANGKILYRDLDSFVAPGVWLLLAGVFRAFGTSVFVSRMASLACYFATALVLYRIVRLTSTRRYADLAVIAYASLSIWAFPAWHFAFYSAWSVLGALCALERLVSWQRDSRPAQLVTAGFFVGVSALFKQNYGALAGTAIAIAVALEIFSKAGFTLSLVRGVAARGLVLLAGTLIAIVPVTVYFWLNGALSDLVHSLVVRPFSEFAAQHTLPFPPLSAVVRSDFFVGRARLSYEAVPVSMTAYPHITPPTVQRLVQIMHIALYWAPVALFAVAALLLARKARASKFDGGLAASLSMAGCLFLGVFPRADFNHLINVYQPIIVLTALVAHSIESSLKSGVKFFRALALGACIPFAAVGLFWYALVMRSMRAPLAMPRGGVMVDILDASLINDEVALIRELSAPGEPVLAMPGLAMLNFLAERPMPGAYANFFAVHIAHDGGQGVVQAVEKESVRWAIVENFDYFADDLKMREFAPVLMTYLHRNFRQKFGIANDRHWILERRETPLPPYSRTSVLSSCDTIQMDFAPRVVRSRLLYDGLYHRFRGPGVTDPRVLETRCEVSVPRDGRLYFSLGYRQPDRASGDAAISAKISVTPLEGRGRRKQIFSETMTVTPVSDWVSPAPREHLLPLDAYGGRRVRLTFRTTFTGEVVPNFLDFEGFAVTWNDVNIETTTTPSGRADNTE